MCPRTQACRGVPAQGGGLGVHTFTRTSVAPAGVWMPLSTSTKDTPGHVWTATAPRGLRAHRWPRLAVWGGPRAPMSSVPVGPAWSPGWRMGPAGGSTQQEGAGVPLPRPALPSRPTATRCPQDRTPTHPAALPAHQSPSNSGPTFSPTIPPPTSAPDSSECQTATDGDPSASAPGPRACRGHPTWRLSPGEEDPGGSASSPCAGSWPLKLSPLSRRPAHAAQALGPRHRRGPSPLLSDPAPAHPPRHTLQTGPAHAPRPLQGKLKEPHVASGSGIRPREPGPRGRRHITHTHRDQTGQTHL